tara:strand:+ start:1065 stop:1418 length:354 start_codon:yes stop_codon:yes gene_type:complete
MKIIKGNNKQKIINCLINDMGYDFESMSKELKKKLDINQTKEEYIFDAIESFNFFDDWVLIEYDYNNLIYVCCIIDFKKSIGYDFVEMQTYSIDNKYNIIESIHQDNIKSVIIKKDK